MVHVESTLLATQGTLSQNRLWERFSQRTRYCVVRAGDFSEVRIFAVFDAGMIVAAETVTEP